MPDRYVTRHSSGKRAVKAAHAKRASDVCDTQIEAIRCVKDIVADEGGEVRIQGRDGNWRDSDTVPPGNDPSELGP